MHSVRILKEIIPFRQVTLLPLVVMAAILAPGCKKSSSSAVKIVGGTEVANDADQRVMHATVAIYVDGPNGKFGGCTGTLIGPRHVVTAAHCADPSIPKLYIGWGPRFDSAGPMVEATAVTPHPLWDPERQEFSLNDVAVISLAKALPAPMKPVAMASIDAVTSGTELILAGYGLAAAADATTVGHLRQVKVKAQTINKKTRDLQIESYTKRGACSGDSGGPAFIDEGGTLKLVGATSGPGHGMVNVKCDEGHGTWNMVNFYQGWIKCAFAAQQNPIDGLVDDASSSACGAKSAMASHTEQKPEALVSSGTWCDPNKPAQCFPYCTNGSSTGGGFGWQEDLGGSCKVR